jgi:hypothetical protein
VTGRSTQTRNSKWWLRRKRCSLIGFDVKWLKMRRESAYNERSVIPVRSVTVGRLATSGYLSLLRD